MFTSWPDSSGGCLGPSPSVHWSHVSWYCSGGNDVECVYFIHSTLALPRSAHILLQSWRSIFILYLSNKFILIAASFFFFKLLILSSMNWLTLFDLCNRGFPYIHLMYGVSSAVVHKHLVFSDPFAFCKCDGVCFSLWSLPQNLFIQEVSESQHSESSCSDNTQIKLVSQNPPQPSDHSDLNLQVTRKSCLAPDWLAPFSVPVNSFHPHFCCSFFFQNAWIYFQFFLFSCIFCWSFSDISSWPW